MTTSAANVVASSSTATTAIHSPTTSTNNTPSTAPTTSQSQPPSQPATTRVMQSDEDFNIRFVNLVRTHKCLYDKKVPEYRNRDNQEKAWSLISHQTSESVIHCKERWRNLRACLSRYIKQQSCADPQHKPYYLTEHMAFLLPFLKSTRNSLDSVKGNKWLFELQQQAAAGSIQVIPQPHLQFNSHSLEMKHSLSDNEDEETIDAFDPAITAGMHLQHAGAAHQQHSPPLSDTASANSLQNLIPDVQLAELRTPDTVPDMSYANVSMRNRNHSGSSEFGHEPKRIKTECHASEATTTAHLQMYGNENSDMEFFRSILPDIAALTPQQKRKFKIGILELIDDVVERFPAERAAAPPTTNVNNSGGSGKSRRSSAREWRKS